MQYEISGASIVLKQFPGQRDKAENCIGALQQHYPDMRRDDRWGLVPVKHRLVFLTEADTLAAAAWIDRNA